MSSRWKIGYLSDGGCDAAPLLEAAKHTLDDVALFVDSAVVFAPDLVDLLGRIDKLGAMLDHLSKHGATG